MLDYYGIRWTEGRGKLKVGMRSDPPYFGHPYGVSDDGTVVVGGTQIEGEYVSYVWEEKKGTRYLRDLLKQYGLDVTGWKSLSISSISPNGQFLIGMGDNPKGVRETWVARISLR